MGGRGGGVNNPKKTNIEGESPKKGRGLRQFVDLRGEGGGLGKKEGVVFLRGEVDTIMHTMKMYSLY